MATKKAAPLSLPSVDALFGIPEGKEAVQEIPIIQLHSFKDHPFRVVPDEKLLESVKEYGVLSPLLARKREDGEYELISGHRRKAAAEQVELEKLPVLVRELTDEETVILMVDSNIQRENLLPSEKAFAYRMKVEAIKRQGQKGLKRANAREVVAEEAGVNRMEITRYIRLTYLIPEILGLVDGKQLPVTTAVELSYLTEEEQRNVLESGVIPSLTQAKKLREEFFELEPPQKAPSFSIKTFRPYFPKEYTTEQIIQKLIALLEGESK